ncbi:MAG: large conductance mechanosensitive channel protein MscL [Candidatus Dojkabacteria bacterium]|jgi:large conductance mechanosensitive channel|nr:large conductance mechanosensitive channel protein MscL [Candidatus Dojkabacteria bacterium]
MANLKKTLRSELSKFKEFALKDNVISLAVGVIIGVAFKDLVDVLVKNVFTPPIGYLTANLDFSELFITLGKKQYDTLLEAQQANAVVIQYGLVLNSVITFFITAVILYIIVRAINKATVKKEKVKAEKQKSCPYCLSEIPIKAKKCAYCTSNVK